MSKKNKKPEVIVNKKKLIPMIIGLTLGFILIMIIFSSIVSALAIDYSNEDMTAHIKDTILWGLINVGEQGTMELKSHNSVSEVLKVGLGWNVNMYYDTNFGKAHQEALGEVTFINMYTGEEVEKEWKYVYWFEEEYQSPIEECIKNPTGDTFDYNCNVIGTETKRRGYWKDYNSKDIPKGKIRIGIMVNNKEGEYIDGIWEVQGKKIKKHASWTASLNTDLVTYYKFDEQDTTGTGTIIDSLGTYNMTNNQSSNTTGKINTAYDFDGINDNMLGVNLPQTTDFTISFWADTDLFADTEVEMVLSQFKDTGNQRAWLIRTLVGTGFDFIVSDNGVFDAASKVETSAISTNQFYHVVFRYNSTHLTSFVNGSFDKELAYSDGIFDTNALFKVSIYDGLNARPTQYYDGTLDEIGIWNRALSDAEVTQLWNNGDGISYSNQFLTMTLNSPADFTNTTNPSVTFNGTVTIETPVNVSLIIDDVYNETNTTGILGDYLFTKILADGTYTWNMETCKVDLCNNGTARTLTVDSTKPALTVLSPNETFSLLENGTTLYFAGFANDSNLDTCIREYNGINNTFSCTTATLFNESFDQLSATTTHSVLYVNDTVGNTESLNTTWGYKLYKEYEIFTASVLEGSSSTFSLGVLTNGSDVTLANLSYDATGYIGTISQSGNNFTITRAVTAPLVTTDTNKSFFWQLTQQGQTTSFAAQNQTVTTFPIDDCTANTVTLYNFTMEDEEFQNFLNATGNKTLGKVEVVINSFGTSSQVTIFNKSYSETNPFRVCINSSLGSGEKYNVDTLVEYSGLGYQTEFYNIQNETVDSDNLHKNISLKVLNTTDAQTFRLILKSSSFLPIADALIEVQRKYIDEGVFKVVEIPKTDGNGETIASLVTNDVIYRFVIKKFGSTVATFNNVRANCQTPLVTTCTIDFNAFSSGIEIPDYIQAVDFNYTLGFDSSTRIITSQFVIPSGNAAVVLLNVSTQDALSTELCTDTLTSNQGTLSCTIPSTFGNATVIAKLYKDGNFVAQGQVKLDEDPKDIYDGILVVLGIFAFMTLIGASIGNNPIFTAILLMVGVIALFSMNIVSASSGFIAGATILYVIVAIVLIIIKGSNRS